MPACVLLTTSKSTFSTFCTTGMPHATERIAKHAVRDTYVAYVHVVGVAPPANSPQENLTLKVQKESVTHAGNHTRTFLPVPHRSPSYAYRHPSDEQHPSPCQAAGCVGTPSPRGCVCVWTLCEALSHGSSLGGLTQTRSVRQSFTQCPDADTAAGRRSPYTARSLIGRGMLFVRLVPIRVGGRPMRHGEKGACVIACVCD